MTFLEVNGYICKQGQFTKKQIVRQFLIKSNRAGFYSEQQQQRIIIN